MNFEYTDLWPLLQQDILGLLQADDFIGTRQGVLIEPGDIKNVVDTKLAKIVGAGLDGKKGVGFLVLPIERADDDNPSDPFSPFKLTITVQFVENVIINQSTDGTKIPIRIFAARAAKIMKLYTPVGFTQSLVARSPMISEFTDDTSKGNRCGQVEFTATEASFGGLARLNRPQISFTGSAFPYVVTVAQPVAAKIFYTLDGSHPYDRNAAAQIYSGPVTVTQPGLFRARAFGCKPSDVASDTAAQNFC